MKHLIDYVDLAGLEKALTDNPALANRGVPYSAENPAEAHPLHRICDGVFEGRYTDAAAVEMARIFLAFGARVDGVEPIHKRDTPLIAAASLHADQCALLFIEAGADLHHAGTAGGTALHWAAWCGADRVVERLLEKGAIVDQKCIDHRATPLFWAIHGHRHGGDRNRRRQAECARLLLRAGADPHTANGDGTTIFDLLGEEDAKLREMLQSIEHDRRSR